MMRSRVGEGFFRPETGIRAGAGAGGAGVVGSLLYPPLADIARRNRAAYVVLFALAPFLGSTLTFALILLAGWSLISVVLGRIPFRIAPPDRPVVLSCLAFVAVLSVIDLSLNGSGGIYASATLLLYILPALQISRMRVTDPPDVLPNAVLGLAIGGAAIGVVALAQQALGWHRSEGLMGNPGPFSVAALVAAGGAFLCFRTDGGRLRNAVALLGLLGALAALFLTGMRGTWLALPPVAAVLVWARAGSIRQGWRALPPRWRWSLAAAGLAAAAGLVLVVLPQVEQRLGSFDSDLQALMEGDEAATSLSLRWEIYEAGLAAFRDAPLVGYGFSHVWTAIVPYFRTATFADFGYSHLHNIVLTMGVAGGALGVLALLWLLFAPLYTALAYDAGTERERRERIAFAALLLLAFLVPGLTNVSITHDILDGIWILAAPTLAASVPAGARRRW